MALIPESGRSPGEKRKLLSHVQPRLPTPWHSPGYNTGVGSVSLLQGISPTQGSNPGILHCKWILYQLSYQGRPAHSGEGNDNPLQYSCLENPTDREAWRAIVHGVAKSWASWANVHTCSQYTSTGEESQNIWRSMKQQSVSFSLTTTMPHPSPGGCPLLQPPQNTMWSNQCLSWGKVQNEE